MPLEALPDPFPGPKEHGLVPSHIKATGAGPVKPQQLQMLPADHDTDSGLYIPQTQKRGSRYSPRALGAGRRQEQLNPELAVDATHRGSTATRPAPASPAVVLVSLGPVLLPAPGAPPVPRACRVIFLPEGRAALLEPVGIAVPPASAVVRHPLMAAAHRTAPLAARQRPQGRGPLNRTVLSSKGLGNHQGPTPAWGTPTIPLCAWEPVQCLIHPLEKSSFS